MIKKISIGLGVIIGLLAFAKVLGIVVNYTLPTTSNEPTLPLNSHLIATSLVSPDIGDFATFHPPIPGDVKEVFIKRLCGLEGDLIEMKNGVFYRNGENFDKDLILQHSFIVEDNTYKQIQKKYPITDANVHDGAVAEIQITDTIALEFEILNLKRLQDTPDAGPPLFMGLKEAKLWTRDNFGPLTIPTGMAFFMGDNRHYSYDCRFYGFAPVEDITGTILWK